MKLQKSLAAMFCFCLLVLASAYAAENSTAPQPAADNKKPNIAVTNLKNANEVTEGEVELLADRLRAELFNTGMVNVMEREQMQEILKEQGFQQSGACTDEACLVQMGQMLGVQKLVSGSLGKLGGLFMVNLRVIDVKTGQIVKVVSKDIKGNIEDIVGELRPIALELVGNPGSPPTAAQAQNQTAAPQPTFIPGPAPSSSPETFKASPVSVHAESEKNRNRFGLMLNSSILPGEVTIKSTVSGGSSSTSSYQETGTLIMSTSTVKFAIPIGPFFSGEAGVGYSHGSAGFSEYYMQATNLNTRNTYNALSLAAGFNFVKRFHPFKLNAGVLLDFSALFLKHSDQLVDTLTKAATWDTTYFDQPASGATFGFRLGVEYLLDKHIGLGVDGIFGAMNYNQQNVSSPYDIEAFDITHTILLRGISFDVNYYF